MTQENIGGEQKIRMGMRIDVSLEHIQNCSPVVHYDIQICYIVLNM